MCWRWRDCRPPRLAGAGGVADSVTLNLASATANLNVDANAVSITGVETLNVSATTGVSGTARAVTLASGGADKLTSVNLSGTSDISFDGTNSAKAINLVSTTSGAVTISGNFVATSTVTTGAGKDSIALGQLGTTYNSGAGNDSFTSSDEALIKVD